MQGLSDSRWPAGLYKDDMGLGVREAFSWESEVCPSFEAAPLWASLCSSVMSQAPKDWFLGPIWWGSAKARG